MWHYGSDCEREKDRVDKYFLQQQQFDVESTINLFNLLV